jgi:hypothetical protein
LKFKKRGLLKSSGKLSNNCISHVPLLLRGSPPYYCTRAQQGVLSKVQPKRLRDEWEAELRV